MKTLKKDVSYKYKCKFDGRKCNSNQKWNNDRFQWHCKKHHTCEKDYIWNPATCSCKNGKYLASIIDDSAVTCDEIIDEEETKTIPKIQSVKQKVYVFNWLLINYHSIIESF